MGSTEQRYPADGEGPPRTVRVDASGIAAHAVNNDDFAASSLGPATSLPPSGMCGRSCSAACCPTISRRHAGWPRRRGGGRCRRPPGTNRRAAPPTSMAGGTTVVHVSWSDARAYCRGYGRHNATGNVWEWCRPLRPHPPLGAAPTSVTSPTAGATAVRRVAQTPPTAALAISAFAWRPTWTPPADSSNRPAPQRGLCHQPDHRQRDLGSESTCVGREAAAGAGSPFHQQQTRLKPRGAAPIGSVRQGADVPETRSSGRAVIVSGAGSSGFRRNAQNTQARARFVAAHPRPRPPCTAGRGGGGQPRRERKTGRCVNPTAPNTAALAVLCRATCARGRRTITRVRISQLVARPINTPRGVTSASAPPSARRARGTPAPLSPTRTAAQ